MLLFKLVFSLVLTWWTIAVSAIPADNEPPSPGGKRGGRATITREMAREWKKRTQSRVDEKYQACVDGYIDEFEQTSLKYFKYLAEHGIPYPTTGAGRWYHLREEITIDHWDVLCSLQVYKDYLAFPSQKKKTGVKEELRRLKSQLLEAEAKKQNAAPEKGQDEEGGQENGQSNAFSDLKTNIKGLGSNVMQAIGRVHKEGSNTPGPVPGSTRTHPGFGRVPGRFGAAP